jgi:poly(A) polymerase
LSGFGLVITRLMSGLSKVKADGARALSSQTHKLCVSSAMIKPALTKLLANPALKQVWAALDVAQPGATRLVGGCVRDALLGITPIDVDLATQLLPEQVIATCQTQGIRTIPTGMAHGTITAIVDGKSFEITTLRKDIATDGRHAQVAFTDDWHADAMRRDFTMNALYLDADGIIHDPTEQGVADAKAGRVVFVGDPDQRILEDHLRILRFFRFSARFEKRSIDGDALAACGRHANAIANLSVERVWGELKRILATPDPRSALKAMATSGVLAAVLPEAKGLIDFNNLVAIETSAFLDVDPMQRLMALLPRDTAIVSALSARLKLSNTEMDRLTAWANDQTKLVSYLSAREVRAALYWMGNGLYLDRVRLAWASDPEPRRTTQWRTMIAFEGGFVAPKFPVGGNQVIAAGARPGPAVGAILAEVERWWVENDFIDDELSVIERLKAVVQGLG